MGIMETCSVPKGGSTGVGLRELMDQVQVPSWMGREIMWHDDEHHLSDVHLCEMKT